ncbi:VOC family protein [Streptomyces platensis]|uniref:27 kDa antigen Cfp30B n=2 Tax=Streptomyces TaxID=1883 RepID=A0AAE6NNM8_STRPT|nr:MULTISPECIES: VOC family protein [Streptomyces]BCK67247.1 glyoxalase [Streptomyces libani subsp. rufus]OSY47961.1 27 kDa antigen Cfp30B [Streptomyces platensis]QEV55616.1 VOC family protein [Streptomyces platensis]GFE13076.1 glyoxalase [Streptomyces glebosus]GHG56562.1 glyoxalase [Streptomyces glebosus]
MPEVTAPYQPGTPCWIDLAAPDQQAAIDFYAQVFGWTGEIGPPETGGYAVCELNGKPVAGIMAAVEMGGQPAPPTVWTTYLAAADADATSEAVRGADGTVLMPVMDVMTLGRMCIAADPTGAVFGIWQPRDFPGAGIVNEHGALIWNELNTTDPSAAAAFYKSALGIESAPMEGADNYYSLQVNDRPVGGMQPMSEQMPADTPSHWLAYFSVADADATVEKVTAAGGAALQRPFDMIAGRMAVVSDPQGATFAVITPKPMNQG